MDRKDFKFISGWIEKDSTVLDLGCGDSTLLNFLRKNKNVKGYGFEKDIKKVQESISKNISEQVVEYLVASSNKSGLQIIKERGINNLDTEDLVNLINSSKKKFTKKNKATKIFQALRILVNSEISELIIALSKSSNLISNKGIIVTVTFHSIEDKICKFFFNTISTHRSVSRYLPVNKNEELAFSIINKKVITPTNKEIKINPPSRSAKLRSIKRTNAKKIDTNFLYRKFKNLLEIEKLSQKLWKNIY